MLRAALFVPKVSRLKNNSQVYYCQWVSNGGGSVGTPTVLLLVLLLLLLLPLLLLLLLRRLAGW